MTTNKSFGSDNHSGAHPAVLRALSTASAGDAVAYGADTWTTRAEEAFRDRFGSESRVFFVFNGSAANVFGISLLLRPYEGVICPETAHLNTDECGAIERVLGNKLLTVPTSDGKLTPDLVARRLGGRLDQHRVQPRVVSIAQVTEVGTCYTLAELRGLGDFCHSNGLLLYVDGARLANAAAYLECSLRELGEHVDALSFGGTKNGALGAEAVVVTHRGIAADSGLFLRKQQMQLASKMRFISAQFIALFEGDLWLRSAQHANAMARRLAEAVREIPGIELRYPVQSNAVFAVLDPDHIARLRRDWYFYVWDESEHSVRWMTGFDTTEADIDAFVADLWKVTCADAV